MSEMEYARELILPSLGKFYQDKVPGGCVMIQPWGTAEQKLLAGAQVLGDRIEDRLLTAGLIDPALPVTDMIVQDRLAILINVRALSYGSDYAFEYKCSECNQKIGDQIDLLTGLESLNPKDDWTEPFELTLPITKKTLSVRYLRGSDVAAIARYGKQIVAKGGGGDGEPEYYYRHARRIDKVDGKEIKVNDAIDLVKSLRGRDSLALQDGFSDRDFGINLEMHLTCKLCGWEQEQVLPVTRDFFRPRRRKNGDSESDFG